MPKWIKPGLLVSIVILASLLTVMGCGGDDTMNFDRSDPLEVISGDTNLGGGGGGAGSGATGACEWTVIFFDTPSTACYQGFDNAMCSQLTSGGGTVNFTSGGSCESLGYSCGPPVDGYTVCI